MRVATVAFVEREVSALRREVTLSHDVHIAKMQGQIDTLSARLDAIDEANSVLAGHSARRDPKRRVAIAALTLVLTLIVAVITIWLSTGR